MCGRSVAPWFESGEDELAHHFRQFIYIETEAGEELTLRFADGVVLHALALHLSAGTPENYSAKPAEAFRWVGEARRMRLASGRADDALLLKFAQRVFDTKGRHAELAKSLREQQGSLAAKFWPRIRNSWQTRFMWLIEFRING